MRTQWQPFTEPWHVTALRTGSIAVAIGVAVGLSRQQLAAVPSVILFALWFSLGGHFLEVIFRNHLSHRFDGGPLQAVARLAFWFVGGAALYACALGTNAVLMGRGPGAWRWWAGGAGFVALELAVHVLLRARGHASFYDGLG